MKTLALILALSCLSIQGASCPTGFQALGKLGCIQTKREGQARCIEAITQCFTNHEGRLPSYAEMVAALTTDMETDLKYEWVDGASVNTVESNSGSGSGFSTTYRNCGIVGTTNSNPIADVHYNKTIGFRCFVPFSP